MVSVLCDDVYSRVLRGDGLFAFFFFFFFLLLGRFVGERERERERKIELGRRFVLLVQFVKNVIRRGKTRGKNNSSIIRYLEIDMNS